MELGSPAAWPQEGEVHVWSFALAAFAARASDLSTPERHRGAAFAGAERRQVFERARVGLRHILADYLGTDPRTVSLLNDATGRPVLNEPAGLSLSLAHSGGVALCAVAPDRPVGIDLEHARAMPEAASLAKGLLPPVLAGRLASVRPPARDRLLLGCWTRIEAIGKADGRGVSAGLRIMGAADAACALAPDGWRGRIGPYWLEDLRLGAGWYGALAVQGPEARLHRFEVAGARSGRRRT